MLQWTVNVCSGNIGLIVTGTSASSSAIEPRASRISALTPALPLPLLVGHGSLLGSDFIASVEMHIEYMMYSMLMTSSMFHLHAP
jgi:hypothetical protein